MIVTVLSVPVSVVTLLLTTGNLGVGTLAAANSALRRDALNCALL